jgi:hypothetical protein
MFKSFGDLFKGGTLLDKVNGVLHVLQSLMSAVSHFNDKISARPGATLVVPPSAPPAPPPTDTF